MMDDWAATDATNGDTSQANSASEDANGARNWEDLIRHMQHCCAQLHIYKDSSQRLIELCSKMNIESEGATLRWIQEFHDCLVQWSSWDIIPSLARWRSVNFSLERMYKTYCTDVVAMERSSQLSGSLLNSFDPSISETVAALRMALNSKDSVESILCLAEVDAIPLIELLDQALGMLEPGTSFYRTSLRILRKLCALNAYLPEACTLKQESLQITSQYPEAAGSYGDILRGQYKDRDVAVKALRIIGTSDIHRIKQNLCREAILWKYLSHDNIVPFLGVDLSQSRLCMIPRWMPMGNISSFLRVNPEVDRLPLVIDIAQGLEYLHSLDVVHGDLKGANILIDYNSRACLSDFGLTAIVYSMDSVNPASSSHMHGSVRWMAPECLDPDAAGIQSSTALVESDVHSFSMVMWEVFTGLHPYDQCRHDATAMHQILSGLRPKCPGEAERNGLSSVIWELMEKCWNPDWRKRPRISTALHDLRKAIVTQNPVSVSLAASADDSLSRVRGGDAAGPVLTSSLEHIEHFSALEDFFDFCDSQGVVPARRLPADEHILCAFVASRANTNKRHSVRDHVAALRHWHISCRVKWTGGLRLEYLLSSLEDMSSSDQLSKLPVTRNMLELLHANLEDTSPESSCILAVADIAFWTQTCPGQLLFHMSQSFDISLAPLRSDLLLPHNEGEIILHCPFKGDHVRIIGREGPSDPTYSVRTHLAVNAPLPDDPLFSFKDANPVLWSGPYVTKTHFHRWTHLTERRFSQVCHDVWQRNGIPQHNAFSFSVGGAIELLIAGADPLHVRTIGKWSANDLLRRFERLEGLRLATSSNSIPHHNRSDEVHFDPSHISNRAPLGYPDPGPPRAVSRIPEQGSGTRQTGLHVRWVKEKKTEARVAALAAGHEDMRKLIRKLAEDLKTPMRDEETTPSMSQSTLPMLSFDTGSFIVHDQPKSLSFEGQTSSSRKTLSSTNSDMFVEWFPKRYFILKSLTKVDLDMSVEKGLWVTQWHNVAILDRAFRTSKDVYLIFSRNNGGEFFGYARMIDAIEKREHHTDSSSGIASSLALEYGKSEHLSLPKLLSIAEEEMPAGDGEATRSSEEFQQPAFATGGVHEFGKPFRVQWICTESLPFSRTRHLRNPWDHDREVKVSRDGIELEPSVGQALLDEWARPVAPLPSRTPRRRRALRTKAYTPKTLTSYPELEDAGWESC